MPKKKPIISTSDEQLQPMRPALTPEARENQLISLSYDLVEKRLREGTATSQETTYFLKLGSSKTRLENEKLKAEKELLEAKVSSLESSTHTEEGYLKVIEALRMYRGEHSENDENEEF